MRITVSSGFGERIKPGRREINANGGKKQVIAVIFWRAKKGAYSDGRSAKMDV